MTEDRSKVGSGSVLMSLRAVSRCISNGFLHLIPVVIVTDILLRWVRLEHRAA